MSHVCGNIEDIMLNPHLPDFTHDCVCPTLLQIRPRASVRQIEKDTGTAVWRVWREELFVTAGQQHPTPLPDSLGCEQYVPLSSSFIRHLVAFATYEEEVLQTTSSFMILSQS